MKKTYSMKKSLFWLIPALCFLFNPNIAVIDVLPDFIGYIFLCLALSKIADLNDDLAEAKTAFLRMIFVDAGKILAIFWIFGMESAGEKSSSFLLWAFVFAFVELILLIPAYRKLFDGILHFGNFYESEMIFKKPRRAKGEKSTTERLKTFTVFFVSAKAILSFLPELADLTNFSYDERGAVLNLYQYIGTMRALCFIPMLIIGLIWLVRMQRYVAGLRKDSALMQGLDAAYVEKVLPRTGMFIGRSVSAACVALMFAAVLSLDFRLDHINLIPDALSFVGFLFFYCFLKKRTALKKGFWTLSLTVYGTLTVVSTVAQILFFARYTYGSLLRNDTALMFFGILVGIEVLKVVFFVLIGICTAHSFNATIAEHTGFIMSQHSHADVIAKHVQAVQKEQRRYVWYMLVAMILYAISDVAYEILNVNYGVMGTVNMIFGLIWIVTVWKAQSEIVESVKTKYMLES